MLSSSRMHNYIYVNTGFLPKPAAICKQFSQTHNMSVFGDVSSKLELIHLHFTGRTSIILMVRVNGLRRRDGLASATCSELRQGRQRLKSSPKSQRSQTFCTHISSLPPEILQEIFLQCVPTRSNGQILPVPMQGLYSFESYEESSLRRRVDFASVLQLAYARP